VVRVFQVKCSKTKAKKLKSFHAKLIFTFSMSLRLKAQPQRNRNRKYNTQPQPQSGLWEIVPLEVSTCLSVQV
jgi:hypothetical protein